MDAIPPVSSGGPEDLTAGSPSALLDFLIPGFSIYATAVSKYLHIDLNLYIPLVLLFGGLIFVWRYFSEYFSGVIESHLMSVVDIRPDDEIYNMLMAWVANQRFARSARRFVVNTNVNSRSWMLWRSFEDDEEDEEEEGEDHDYHNRRRKKRALAYTPTFGSHWFLYKNRILIFKRTQNSGQNSFLTASEREEISISCFGRNPWVLKELLHEAREVHMKRDEAKTLIYRGTTRSGSTEPVWQRSMARTSRPFSTVILNEKVKKDLIDDVTDYLNPATQRWYSNRGIPYRRGYLLHGPPGTGKSSLSLALAGFFKMRIYIVSLSSVTANEENLATLFAELPRRCVVLLEDIDTAGLTHTRDNAGQDDSNDNDNDNDENTTTKTRSSRAPGQNATTNNNNNSGRLSLSGLLNILDGVSSQEGRVLIMTTNHIEKLDKALIRPGRVDMIVKFDRADTEMTAAIFRAIYAPLEGDDAPSPSAKSAPSSSAGTIFQFTRHSDDSPTKSIQLTDEEEKARAAEAAEAARKKEETIARVDVLAAQFAAKIPAHEFSPAEIQGYLLKNKRDPERTVAGAEEWVAETRKAKKEKELKEAEEKREREEKEREEKEREEKERKEKEEEEKKKKKEEEEEKKKKEEGEEKKRKKKGKKEKEKRKGAKKSKKKAAESESSGSESSSEEESESEAEKETSKKRSKAAAAVAPVEEKAPAPEIKVEPASVPAITVDTDKAKEAAVEQQKTPQGADSGYGTP